MHPRPHYTPHYHTLTTITTPLHRHIQQYNFLHEARRNASGTPFDRARRALSIGRKGLSVRAFVVVHFLFLRFCECVSPLTPAETPHPKIQKITRNSKHGQNHPCGTPSCSSCNSTSNGVKIVRSCRAVSVKFVFVCFWCCLRQ